MIRVGHTNADTLTNLVGRFALIRKLAPKHVHVKSEKIDARSPRTQHFADVVGSAM